MFVLGEKDMSEQQPDNKTKAEYLIQSRLVKLEIRDINKTKPKDDDYETYIITPVSPSTFLTGTARLECEKEGLIIMNNENQETYTMVNRREGTGRLKGEKEGLIIKMNNEKQETYNIDDVRPTGTARLEEEKENLIKMNDKKLETYNVDDIARTGYKNMLEKKEDVHTDKNTSTHCKTYLGHFSPPPSTAPSPQPAPPPCPPAPPGVPCC